MSSYIIILSSTIDSPVDLQNIEQVITGFSEVLSWSVDLEDCDKILRLSCTRDIGAELMNVFSQASVNAALLEVFDEQGRSITAEVS
ncbi:hypothetical protein H9X96_04495 [Pedobacter sp. N36a]|uniref:hypothetical protein n=1 Tax=Pedobacter sp. N36a TaxID=2767996 RepID=UPI0016576223|nr:hypothetical protein [Pedobacter sp. N36a]MBC8985030.1 hypothetical protein [Pedobacter sp. N36a]